MTLVIATFGIIPVFKPIKSLMSSVNRATLNSLRGSRPGLTSSARMSFTVGSPQCSSAARQCSRREQRAMPLIPAVPPVRFLAAS